MSERAELTPYIPLRARLAALADAQAALLSTEDRLRREGWPAEGLRRRIVRKVNALGLRMSWLEGLAYDEMIEARIETDRLGRSA